MIIVVWYIFMGIAVTNLTSSYFFYGNPMSLATQILVFVTWPISLLFVIASEIYNKIGGK